MNKIISESEELSEEPNSKELRELERAISLSPTAMFELSSNPQLLRKKLQEFNDHSVLRIEKEEYNEALIYLEQAEKILEYAVSCGKRIHRTYIICTMQNEACAYQRLWELDKSAEYMEAIIHNMQCEVQISSSVGVPDIYFSEKQDEKEALKISVNKLTLMALYYLQFSAVSSQIKHHDNALRTARKAMKTLKLVCEKSIKVEMNSSKPVYDSLSGSMLAELATIPEEVQLDKASSYFIEAKKYLAKLKHANSRRRNIAQKTLINFKNFTIGQVMQISPITLTQVCQKLASKEEPSLLNKLYKAIYISICFFALATESRLIANEKYKQDTTKKNSIQFKKSQLYHLKAIYIAAKFIPSETKYLEHIMKSFKNHYQIDLLETTVSDLIDEVSSIEVESQNLVTSYDNKIYKEDENGVNFGNALVKNKIEMSHKEKRNKTIITSDEKIKIKIVSKHKNKKTTINRKFHSKSYKNTNSHMRMTEKQKPKSLTTLPHGKVMHYSLNNKIFTSSEKNVQPEKIKKPLSKIKKKKKNGAGVKGESKESKQSHKGHRQGSRQKNKSKSTSSKKYSHHKDENPGKDRAKQKNIKLQAEYFVSSRKKKKVTPKQRDSSTSSRKRISKLEMPSNIKPTKSLHKSSSQKNSFR